MVAQFLEDLETLFKNVGEKLEGRAAVLAKDLSSSARIASTVAGIRKQKIGRGLLKKEV